MLQDDRVMSILTGLVIVVAMATLAQRSDTLLDFFFGEKEASIAPQNDSAAVFAGQSKVIDVLANDENAKPEDADNLHILVSPSCGAAEATDGGVLYISNDRCVGPQLLAYCVRRGDECASASVTVNVAAATPAPAAPRQTTQTAAAPTPAPEVPAQETPAPAPAAKAAPSTEVARAEPAPTPSQTPAQTQIETAGLNETPQTQPQPQGDVVAAIRAVEPNLASPQLRTPVPVVDDGGQAPVTQEDAAAKEEGGLFQRLFSAPSDDVVAAAAPSVEDTPRVAAVSGTADGSWRPSEAPDVSQIAESAAPPEPEPEIEIAAVTTEPVIPSRERAREEEAARLPAASGGDADSAASAPEPACEVVMTTRPGQGGVARVEVQAGCLASTPLEILHAGVAFGARFDTQGALQFELPIIETAETISARFSDGSETIAPLNIDIRSVEQTRRVVVVWTAPVNLDLHAFEYSAGFGADGHVWEQNPRGFRDVRRPGGGFLTSYPAAVLDGQSVEVYTFWANRRARPGYMRIAVDHASRGEVAEGEFCGAGPLASPDYEVIRSEMGEITSRTRSSFAPANCGQTLSVDARYANGALEDLRIEE